MDTKAHLSAIRHFPVETKKFVRRFWARVQVRDHGPDECWPWNLSRNHQGYGVFYADGERWMAHRVAFEIAHGELQDGEYVLHRCDNPPCCNPVHLFAARKAESIANAVLKGRCILDDRDPVVSNEVELLIAGGWSPPAGARQ